MNATMAIALLIAAAALPLASGRPLAAAPETSPASGVDLAGLDTKTAPCDNFYQFVCGNWLATHPIPPDRPSWGRFDELQEHNMAILHSILDKDAVDAPGRNSVQRQIGDFYAACMDEAGIEAKGTAPLKDDLDRIAALADRAGLAALTAHPGARHRRPGRPRAPRPRLLSKG
jgi:endothelin-converting enzyme/putative endopeptidase